LSENDRPGDPGSCPGGTTMLGVSIANFSSFLSKSELDQPRSGTSRPTLAERIYDWSPSKA
jgi:hypothetical protein